MRPLTARVAILLAAAGAAGPCLAQGVPAPVPATPAPLDPERLALANEVIALAFPPEQRRAMFSRVTEALMAQIRTAMLGDPEAARDPGAEAILQRYFDRLLAQSDRSITAASPTLFAALARAYARAFTRDELIQIRAFVATPAGAKYIQRSAELLSDPDVAAANTAYMAQVLKDVEPIRADLQRELMAYFEKHRPRTRR
jgi:hypothetical protein